MECYTYFAAARTRTFRTKPRSGESHGSTLAGKTRKSTTSRRFHSQRGHSRTTAKSSGRTIARPMRRFRLRFRLSVWINRGLAWKQARGQKPEVRKQKSEENAQRSTSNSESPRGATAAQVWQRDLYAGVA